MQVCIIDLNDAEVRAARGRQVLLTSPGFAVVQDSDIRLGEEAQRLAHLHPRHAYNRFWADLSQDALRVPTARFRHHADLAWAHLQAIHEGAGKPAEIMFAVPGNLTAEQLALLLGIARACPFRAVGLVDSAVAGAATAAGPGSYLHVDVQLHYTVLTQLAVNGLVTRESVETVNNGGLTAIHDACAEFIGDAFIRQCRFDPHHHAETEQALYDHLPGWLGTLADRAEVHAEISYGGSRHQARISREGLLQRLDRTYAGLLPKLAGDRTLLLSHRAAALPGLTDRVHGEVLDPDAVFSGCELHAGTIRSSGPNLDFITSLPAAAEARIRPSPAGRTAAPRATHVLLGHRAYALGAAPLYLSADGTVTTTALPQSSCVIAANGTSALLTPIGGSTTRVNGTALQNARPLTAGDRISFGGAESVYSLIAAVEPDAP
jgi:hypothetical protein